MSGFFFPSPRSFSFCCFFSSSCCCWGFDAVSCQAFLTVFTSTPISGEAAAPSFLYLRHHSSVLGCPFPIWIFGVLLERLPAFWLIPLDVLSAFVPSDGMTWPPSAWLALVCAPLCFPGRCIQPRFSPVAEFPSILSFRASVLGVSSIRRFRPPFLGEFFLGRPMGVW